MIGWRKMNHMLERENSKKNSGIIKEKSGKIREIKRNHDGMGQISTRETVGSGIRKPEEDSPWYYIDIGPI